VTYLSSVDGNTAALGYDTYGPDPVDMDRRARALNKARDIAATCTTGKISIIQEGTDQSGMLFYKPIYKDGIAGNSPEQRREKLTGYVAGVFLIKKMIDASLSSAKFLLGKMDITIYEMADEPSPSLLFDTSRGPDKGSAPSVRQRLGKDYDLAVASGTWKVHIEEKNVSEPAKYNWTLWAVLIGGLLITAILSAFLLVLTGRTAAVQREVEEKTLSMKRLTEKLIRSNTELERFAYVASHDMQEPIRMIASFGGLLAAMPANNKTEKEKQYLGFVTESANRLQAMVEDLLEYARIGNTAQRFIGVDLNKQLEFALQNLSGAISDRHAEITVDRLPLVSGNPFQLARLFQNLIQNSLKYQQQGIFPRIHISSADEGNHWRISVADNGEGIAAEYIARIFEPFRRLHSWHEEKGTGLGLAICKTIVEGHGGNIWATSEPGKGSIFYFTMPKQERGA
jgi:signal transduction histidine kinase